MIVKAYKTHKIRAKENLNKILDTYLPELKENSVVAVTSKIVSLCQGNIVKNDGTVDKRELIKREADYYFEDENLTRFGTVIPTIKDGILIANAGIDESNVDGDFVLWPKNADQVAEEIWTYLREKHNLAHLGVILTDSHLLPLRWGIHGVGITWCGFTPLKDYRGEPDIFGRKLKMSQESILDGLAAAAVTVMGEGSEQTPLAVITDLPFVEFKIHPPTKEEREQMVIQKEDDIYGKLLTSVEWEKGK